VTDLRDLFELALADDAGGGARIDVAADPAADLARGKKLLARRTSRRMLGGAAATAAAAAIAVGAVAVVPSGPGAKPSHPGVAAGQRTAAGHRTAASQSTAARIRLVAYTGAQPPGYTVKVIPAGWVIQGSNPYALVIAPANAPNKDPDVFVGKLFVGQGGFDVSDSSAQGWAPFHITGRTAYYSVQDSTAGLEIEETPSDWLTVQAPTSLGWTKQQVIAFALGVTILPTAQEGKG
jgi:hypothetical protein